jgi:very-short-patch-repair endonuclease
MKGQTNRSIIGNSLQKELRTHMTDAENCLWRHLRGRQIAGFKFRRQHPFLDYVLDFVCLEMRLIVEVDGGQHQDCERDQVRDRRLHEAGFRVVRFWNNQVLQETEVVVEAIWTALHEESADAVLLTSPSPPQPSP